MTEREDQTEEGQDEKSTDEWVQEVEEDPSTAGDPDQPGDELRGG
jgi:hypothetical protein